MRTTIFLLFTCVFCSMAELSYTQNARVTINKRNATIKEILNEIEKQTDYLFLYNDEVHANEKVSVKAKQEAVSSVLNSMLKDKDMKYSMEGNHIILFVETEEESAKDEKALVVQQQRIVTGKVTDQSGQPLPGVTVVVKGTTQGTVTDTDGNYSLSNVPDNATLVFSFVGMETQEINVGNQTRIDVTMQEEAIALQEVVAVGYGTMRKSDLTGSVVRADIEAFRESPNLSVLQSLQGSVPGLNVGQVDMAGEDPTITIRGRNSLSGSQNPLIVLDGVIFHGSLVDLNPNDIASIDVLKDASAASIYGSRAANGVLIIQTKSGRSLMGKPVFNYNVSYSFQEPASYLRGMTREEYIEKTNNIDWQNAYLPPDYLQRNPDYDPTKRWSLPAIVQGYENGTYFDWWDAVTQKPHIQVHNLSLQERSEKSNYFISLNYTDQNGLMLNDYYERVSARINFESQVTNWLSLGVQSFISTNDYSGVNANPFNMWIQSPLVGPYDENGKLLRNPSGQVETNPLLVLEIDDLDKRLNLMGTAYATITVPKIQGLSYKVTYSNNYNSAKKYMFDRRGSNDTGTASKSNSSGTTWSLDNILTYNRNFNSHNINATLVAGREELSGESTKAQGANYSNMALGYNKLEISAADQQKIFSTAWDESNLYYMGRIHYGYKGKYLATFTVRRDGFSGFAENKKFGTFPSAAVAWTASEEDFLKNRVSWLDFLKIRFSYGESGNRTAGRYSTLARVSALQEYVFGDGGNPVVGQYISNMPNTSLTWETTTGYNIGLNFTILQNRISGTVDYYDSDTKDVLYNVNIPFATGFTNLTTNIGKVHNQGLEFTINCNILKTRDFKWDMGINYSRNRNEVVSILGKDKDGDGKEDDLIGSKLFIGKDIASIYDYEIIGIYQLGDDIPQGYQPGSYILNDLNGDGKITPENDRKILGRASPAYRFSISNELSFKAWSLMFFINSVQGGKNAYMQNNDPNYGNGWFWGENVSGAYDSNLPHYDYWFPANPDAEYRSLAAPPVIYAGSYRQRSFIRLQDVSLSYRFNNTLISKWGIEGLKLFISGKNLLTLTNWKGVDPETGQGYYSSQTPVLRSYTVGLDLTF